MQKSIVKATANNVKFTEAECDAFQRLNSIKLHPQVMFRESSNFSTLAYIDKDTVQVSMDPDRLTLERSRAELVAEALMVAHTRVLEKSIGVMPDAIELGGAKAFFDSMCSAIGKINSINITHNYSDGLRPTTLSARAGGGWTDTFRIEPKPFMNNPIEYIGEIVKSLRDSQQRYNRRTDD